MEFLWLGVGPLVADSAAEIFGLKWQAVVHGIAFMSNQPLQLTTSSIAPAE
jgi:hypothetical protein